MIENLFLRLPRSQVGNLASLPGAVEAAVDTDLLRWYVTDVTDAEILVEATVSSRREPSPVGEREAVRARSHHSVVVSIVPTGVGCSVGGYAGDAAPATSLLAATADFLVTNPNAVNASNFIALGDDVLYTEGHAIDELMRGHVELHVPYANRVGLIVERAPDAVLDAVFNLANTVRAVHGIDLEHVTVTDEPIGTRCRRNASGAFAGTVDRPEVLLAAAEDLIAKGVDALAVTTNVQDLPADAYAAHFRGECPNPVGGAEAIVSHLIVRSLGIPAAHAPMVNVKELALEEPVVDARGAGEMASFSGLACVLIGLGRAPQLRSGGRLRAVVGVEDVVAVVAPASCLGGVPTIYAHRRGIPVIAVHGNETILSVTAEKLGMHGVVEVANYLEAAGVCLALSRGLSLTSLLRPLKTLRSSTTPTPQIVESYTE